MSGNILKGPSQPKQPSTSPTFIRWTQRAKEIFSFLQKHMPKPYNEVFSPQHHYPTGQSLSKATMALGYYIIIKPPYEQTSQQTPTQSPPKRFLGDMILKIMNIAQNNNDLDSLIDEILRIHDENAKYPITNPVFLGEWIFSLLSILNNYIAIHNTTYSNRSSLTVKCGLISIRINYREKPSPNATINYGKSQEFLESPENVEPIQFYELEIARQLFMAIAIMSILEPEMEHEEQVVALAEFLQKFMPPHQITGDAIDQTLYFQDLANKLTQLYILTRKVYTHGANTMFPEENSNGSDLLILRNLVLLGYTSKEGINSALNFIRRNKLTTLLEAMSLLMQ